MLTNTGSPGAPAPAARPVPGLPGDSVCFCSLLHPLKKWSLRQTRGGSGRFSRWTMRKRKLNPGEWKKGDRVVDTQAARRSIASTSKRIALSLLPLLNASTASHKSMLLDLLITRYLYNSFDFSLSFSNIDTW